MTYDENDYKEVLKHYNIQYKLDGQEQDDEAPEDKGWSKFSISKLGAAWGYAKGFMLRIKFKPKGW